MQEEKTNQHLVSSETNLTELQELHILKAKD